MHKYVTKVDRWLSHECRLVKAGEEFTTEFPPGPDGKPMNLGGNLVLADEEAKPGKGSKGKKADDDLA